MYRLQTNCGSPLYTSPEIIKGQSYIGPEVDVWAIGVVLYAMVTGRNQFHLRILFVMFPFSDFNEILPSKMNENDTKPKERIWFYWFTTKKIFVAFKAIQLK